jgi:hypothetical protein
MRAGADRRRAFTVAHDHAFEIGKAGVGAAQDFAQGEKLRLAKTANRRDGMISPQIAKDACPCSAV